MAVDFFISYTASDRHWAEWIAGVLEDEGYSTVLQAWDFRPGQNFVENMDRAMRESTRTIAVLSRDYYKSQYAVPEWTNAVTKDPTGRRGVLLPVRVDDVVAEGIFRPLARITLYGLKEDAARKALIDGVRLERVKPTGPTSFPDEVRPRFPGALPPIWRVPHARNPVFAGRDATLAQLRDELAGESQRPAVIAVTGGGGVGKTALAVEHAYRAAADYQVVWWARGQRREFVVADVASLATELDLDGSDHDTAAQFADVRGWLEQHDQWLLVLDEAEGPETVRGLVPQGGGGHVIVTSRNPNWRRDARVLPIDVLEPADAAELLAQRTGHPSDRDADGLAWMLGYLPLALEVAGAFIEQQGLPYADYLRRFQREGALAALASGAAPPDTRQTLATVWAESVAVVTRRDSAATDLLRLCAFLAPDDLPRWLVGMGHASLPGPLSNVAADDTLLADLIATPRAYSLLVTHEDGISLHRLLQEFMRDGLTEDGRKTWAGAAILVVANGLPIKAADTRLWERSGRLFPHAVEAAGHGETLAVEPDKTLWLLDRTATFLSSTKADPDGLRSLRERAMASAEDRLGEDGIPSWLLNNHGMWLVEEGRLDEAKRFLEAAIAQDLKTEGESASLGTKYVNIGVLLRDHGSLDDALGYLQKGVTILDRHVGPSDPVVATAHSHLGQLFAKRNDLDSAAREFARAVQIYETTLGPTALDTVQARGFLDGTRLAIGVAPGPPQWDVMTAATVERDEGRALADEPAYADEAERRLRVAVDGGDSRAMFDLWRLIHADPAHADEARALLDRAAVAKVPEALYWRGRQLADEPGREAEAEQAIRTAVAAGQTYGLYDLGLVLARSPARRDEAETAFRQAVDVGHEEARNDLGLLLLEWPGREAEGEAALREAGARGQSRAFHNLGLWLEEVGRDSEAEVALRAAAEAGYAKSHIDLGVLLDRMGRRPEAEAAFRAAIAAGEPTGYRNLGVLLAMEDRSEEAAAAFTSALDLGLDDVEPLLGKLLRSMPGRQAEAEDHLRRASQAGDARSTVILGDLILRSAGREHEALECFLLGAEQGEPQGWLAFANVAGDHPGQDDVVEQAYRAAIDAGLTEGWNNFGIWLAGIPGREAEAESALEEAIRARHPEGWHNLAVLLRNDPARAADADRAEAFAAAGAGPEALRDS